MNTLYVFKFGIDITKNIKKYGPIFRFYSILKALPPKAAKGSGF